MMCGFLISRLKERVVSTDCDGRYMAIARIRRIQPQQDSSIDPTPIAHHSYRVGLRSTVLGIWVRPHLRLSRLADL
jgi:hypothetical protein